MTSTGTRVFTLAAAIALASGCACDTVPANTIESCEAVHVAPGAVRTDILFVVDDSETMVEEIAALRAALGEFVNVLAASPVKNDFQIGVTTVLGPSGASPNGALIGAGIMPGGDPNLTGYFQATIDGMTLKPGSTYWQEQPFEAMRLAILESDTGGTHPGFIRTGARLAIFFMSDEDDCSVAPPASGSSAWCLDQKAAGTLNPVSGYVSFLQSPILGETKDVVVYAVAGFSQADLALSCGRAQCADQTCSTAFDKGDRFLALVQPFGTGGRIGSICAANLSTSLLEFAGVIMSQTMPLEGAPADPGLLVATVTKASGEVVSCGSPAMAGTAAAATADAIYTPPQEGRPASLTFQFDCALGHGDRVDLKVICAG